MLISLFLIQIPCGNLFSHEANHLRYNFYIYFSDISFQRDEFWKEETQTLDGFMKYLTSWCAYQNYCKANGASAGKEILQEFATK